MFLLLAVFPATGLEVFLSVVIGLLSIGVARLFGFTYRTASRLTRLETLMDLVARKVLNGEYPGRESHDGSQTH